MDNNIYISIPDNSNIEHNEYVQRLLKKYVSNPIKVKPKRLSLNKIIHPKNLNDIKNDLSSNIIKQRSTEKEQNTNDLILNTVLLEKIIEREALITSERNQLILKIMLIIVPIITNVIQFFINYYFIDNKYSDHL